MRLRTLIELLAALMLTFGALFAVSKMARTTAMVDNTNALATIVEMKTVAVCMKSIGAGNELNRLGCTATYADRSAAGIDSPKEDS